MDPLMIRRSAGLALIALSAGCGSQAAVCDDAAVPSVFGTVVDEEGNGLPGALVTYTVDGEERGDCTFNEGAAFVCGSEESGAFVLTASLQGYYEAEAKLPVYAGACHVSSGQVAIQMVARDCTAEEVASVTVTVGTESGAPLENPVVAYEIGGDGTRTACAGSGADWTCGTETTGEFTVYASADGFEEQTATATVVLGEDGCHVATVPVVIAFPDEG